MDNSTPRLHPLNARRGLGHLGRKLMLGKPVTIAYIGGSITSAPGYRVQTTDWFRKQFPQSQITEVDAAIGGTDSRLGAFRLHADVLVHKPDFVIVEFSVNDGERDFETGMSSMEGIVRHCLRSDPQPELLFVYTLADRHMDTWRREEVPGMAKAHERVAEHYRLPSVNMAMALARDLIADKVTWQQMFTDMVHPGPAGHTHYATTLTHALGHLLGAQLEEVPPRAIPAPLTARPLEAGQMREFTPATPTGDFTFKPMVKRGGWEPFAGVLESDKPGSEVAFDFEGTIIGIYGMLGKDGGDLEWSVDDSPFKHYRYFDEFALTCYRPIPLMLDMNLAPGKHRLRVRVSEQRDKRSIGNRVEIGALLYA